MGFKMKGSPIKVDGAIVKFFKGTGRESSAETQSRRRAAGNFTKAELAASKKDFTKDSNFGVSPKVLPKTSQQNFDELMSLPNAVTQPVMPKNKPTQTTAKKKIKTKKKATTSIKRKPIISDETFEKRAKAQGQKPRDGNTKGRKVNITDAQFNKRAKAQGQKPTDGKAPKVDKVLSKRELRLANVKRKAANEKAKTNKTAKSIDTSKSKSAGTGTKQTSARSSRSKAKRLENRATRIQGRIDRKGKSSAEKRASRKATRQKIKENR